MKAYIVILAAMFALVACSEAPPPQQTVNSYQPETVAERTPIVIDAPAGQYRLDPYHSSLHFSVTHLGLSNYVMRFTDFDVTVDLHPDELSASSVQVRIDPTSIRTDFDGDYAGTHPDSPFSSWDEDLVMSPNFLNAGEYPAITFTSSSVTPTDKGTLLVTGDLQMLGETQSVTLEATLIGALEQHPFLGMPVIGFSAEGSFKRSDFGMTHLLNPPLVGDTVTLRFDGELQQQEQSSDET